MKKKILMVLFVIFAFFILANCLNASVTGPFSIIKEPNVNIGVDNSTCIELVGANLAKVIKFFIRLLQIAASIIAIIRGMMFLIPPIMSKDADALKAASKKLVLLGIVLVIIFIFPALAKIIGSLLGFDISCIF